MDINSTEAARQNADATVQFRVIPINGAADSSLSRLPATVPHRLGRLRVLHEVARGGMGVVLRVYDETLDRELAVKVLDPDIDPDSEAGQQFGREPLVAGRLHHPNIIPVYESGMLPDGRPYFVMPFLRGDTFSSRLARREDRGHELSRWLRVFERMCAAVAHAHEQGVVHRDLKPSNVMLGRHGEVLVMDWGVAKILGTPDSCWQPPPAMKEGHWVLGTPAYMSPEQARGESAGADVRCDVFGLGAVLCEILTGEPPYVGPDAEAIRRQSVAGDLSDAGRRLCRCGADPDLIDLAFRCMASNPDDRPADAGAVLRAVSEYLAALESRAHAAELGRVASETVVREEGKRRRLARVMAIAVVVCAFVAALTNWGVLVARAGVWGLSPNPEPVITPSGDKQTEPAPSP
ncbi:MAG TPA: serine/threonine-protein kinase [Gemmataceae bacterium]|nr:serine/threonine-protein kinase [Gemmataceae bacterium]